MKKLTAILLTAVTCLSVSAAAYSPTCAYAVKENEVFADDMITRYNNGEFSHDNFWLFGASYDELGTHFRAYPYYEDEATLVYFIEVTDDENGTYFSVTMYTEYGSVYAEAVPHDWNFQICTGEFDNSHARAELVEEFNFLYDEFVNLAKNHI